MAIKTLESSAWQDVSTLKVPVNGAYQEANHANALVSSAWQEVWGSGLSYEYTSSTFAEMGLSATKNEVRLGFKIRSTESTGGSLRLGIYIYGNFVNPTVRCSAVVTCGSSTVGNNTNCIFAFYSNNSQKSMRSIVGYQSSTTMQGSLTNHTQTGTFDKIFLGIDTYMDTSSLRNKTVKAVLSLIEIDGKGLSGDFQTGVSSYYT